MKKKNMMNNKKFLNKINGMRKKFLKNKYQLQNNKDLTQYLIFYAMVIKQKLKMKNY